MPKISVIIQSHERPQGLRRALRSLQDQTFRDIEVVISDDSREDVAPVVDEFRKSMCIRFRHTTPCGAAESMREAFCRSNGEYIKILHDDDYLMPRSLEFMARDLDSQSDTNVVYGQAIICYSTYDRLFYNFFNRPTKLPGREWVEKYAQDGFGPIQTPVAALYRRHPRFRIVWDEYINASLREAARKTGAGTDINLQVDNAGSNENVIFLPIVGCVLCMDMNSTTETDRNLLSYYEMWRNEYASNPPWKY
jgi:glycosyltransferase involved in cell wall biosynthesis